MNKRVISFSILPKDTKAVLLIAKIKKYANNTGISFSFICLAALTKYYEEVLKCRKK